MKISSREIAELGGLIAIVASLIFVGMQLMLDRKVAMGAQYHERMVLGHERDQGMFASEAYIRERAEEWEAGFYPIWWNDDIEGYQKERNLTLEAVARREVIARMAWIRLNNNYYQYTLGLMPEGYLEDLRIDVKRTMTINPVYRAVALISNTHERGFQNIVSEIDRELSDELQ